jgi:DNA-binding response OmpR family regulator
MDMSRKTKILIVEDDVQQAVLMVQILSRAGCSVLAVHTGKKGMELALENQFDLIALDIFLPDLDGFEICRELKQRHHSRHTPVVLVSGRSSEEYLRRSLKMGAADFIAKPFSATDFALRILSHVSAENEPALTIS